MYTTLEPDASIPTQTATQTVADSPVYVCYIDTDDATPSLKQLRDRASFKRVAQEGREPGRQITALQAGGSEPELPRLEIVCVSDRAIRPSEAKRIRQSALSFVLASLTL